MKKIVIFLSTLIAMSISLKAQWTEQASGTTKNLWGISFINQSLGYVCGDSGTVLKTTDGGLHWTQKNTGVNYQLAGLMFVNADTGYCASWFDNGGKIIKTVNGGETWSDISLNVPNSHCGGGAFFGADTLFMALGSGAFNQSKILKSVNGGISWDTVYYGGTGSGWISFMHFPDRENGYATVSKSGVLKTTDGGNNWTLLNNLGGNLWMSGVYFFNDNTGFVGGGDYNTGGGSIFKTTNGGNSWQTISTIYGTSIMLFTTPDIGFAIGSMAGWNVKKIIKTSDAGTNWSDETTPTIQSLNGIAFPDANTGYAVGDSGTILKYSIGVGLSEQLIPDKKIFFYPNPAKDIIYIYDEQDDESSEISIFDAMGKQVLHFNKMNKSPMIIDISKLEQGVYFMFKNSDNAQKISRFIKQTN